MADDAEARPAPAKPAKVAAAKEPPWPTMSRGLLLTVDECEQWRSITGKWLRQDDIHRAKAMRVASAPRSVVPAKMAPAPPPTVKPRSYFQSSYQLAYGGNSHELAAKPVPVMTPDERPGGAGAAPRSVLVRGADGAPTWLVLSQGSAGRVHRAHSTGNLRPHPHVSKDCDSAARSKITLFGGSFTAGAPKAKGGRRSPRPR
mmetsp:Transcript_73097/g.191614  ORF Transcript_73097/g.191614 Transcript_73097/m.191614 type:complete len:202 (+) Transcript_73097:58-663(+)